MLVDGWRNKSINRKFLVFTLRNIHTPQTFLTFRDTSLEREDGESLAENINNAIQLAKTKYETDVFAIVTDNDSKIVCGGRFAKTVDNRTLLQSTCSSHSGNLLIKQFVKDDFTKKIRDIISTFRDPKLESLLIRFGGTKLINYPDTRFCYVRDTCENLLKNLKFLQNISLLDDIFLPENILNDLFNPEFENDIINTISILTPICKLINQCQDPKLNVADSTELWLSLELPVEDSQGIVKSRIKKAVWPIGYAANFLHHKYKGLKLDNEARNIAESFIQNNLDPQYYDEYLLFCERRETFDALAKKCVNPISFWTFCRNEFPHLSDFAIKLMLVPASTAMLEGMFSTWTYIHNIYRNKLKNDKSSDLLDIYHSLRHMAIKDCILRSN